MKMLVDLWLKSMKWILIVTPLAFVAVFASVPFINVAFPWPVAESELDERGRDGLAICVGMSSSSFRTGAKIVSENQRSYLLVAKGELATVSETHMNGERTVSFYSSRWGCWLVLLLFLLLVWLSLRFSIPRIVSKFRPGREGAR